MPRPLTSLQELNPNFIERLIGFLEAARDTLAAAEGANTALPKKGKNNPAEYTIRDAKLGGSITNISRILDSFGYKTSKFDDLCALIVDNPNSLAKYFNDFLKHVKEKLLDEHGKALGSTIIDALGRDNYDSIVQSRRLNNTEEGVAEKLIAEELIKAVILSFAQIVNDKGIIAEFNGVALLALSHTISLLAEHVTLQGLDNSPIYISSDELRDKIIVLKAKVPEELRNSLETAEFRLAPPAEGSTLTKTQCKIIEIDNCCSAYKIYNDVIKTFKINQLKALLIEAKDLDIVITENSSGNLIDSTLIPKLDSAIKAVKEHNSKQSEQLYSEVISVLRQASDAIKTDITPEKANWFIRLLRFIIRSDRLLQSEKEKNYEGRKGVQSRLVGFFPQEPTEVVPRVGDPSDPSEKSTPCISEDSELDALVPNVPGQGG